MDESFEEFVFEFGGDAVSVVDDGAEVGAAFDAAFDSDGGSAVFAGVGEEVADELAEAESVGADDSGLAGDGDGGSAAGEWVDGFGHFLVDGDVFEDVVEGAGVEAGGGEEVFDHAGEVVGFGDDDGEEFGGGGFFLYDGVFGEEHGEADDAGEGGAEFVAGVGDEFFSGGVELSFGVEAGFEVGLALLAAGEFSVDHDDG